MSQDNSTPNTGAGAFAYAPPTFQCIEVVHPDGTVQEPAAQTESFSEVNDDCHGLLGPFLLSFIPGVVMYALCVFFISASALNWPMPALHSAGLVLAISIALGLVTFFSYRFGVDAGALISAVVFAVVATAVPITEWAAYTFAAMICLSVISIAWSSSKDSVVLEVAS